MKKYIKLFEDFLPGGLADNKPNSEFDPHELSMGQQEEEHEHTNNPDIATEIAKDHLVEDPNFYANEDVADPLIGGEADKFKLAIDTKNAARVEEDTTNPDGPQQQNGEELRSNDDLSNHSIQLAYNENYDKVEYIMHSQEHRIPGRQYSRELLNQLPEEKLDRIILNIDQERGEIDSKNQADSADRYSDEDEFDSMEPEGDLEGSQDYFPHEGTSENIVRKFKRKHVKPYFNEKEPKEEHLKLKSSVYPEGHGSQEHYNSTWKNIHDENYNTYRKNQKEEKKHTNESINLHLSKFVNLSDEALEKKKKDAIHKARTSISDRHVKRRNEEIITAIEMVQRGRAKKATNEAEDSKLNKKMGKVMGEWKAGTLKTGSGKKVTDQKQAIAIGYSEAGKSKKTNESGIMDFDSFVSEGYSDKGKALNKKKAAEIKKVADNPKDRNAEQKKANATRKQIRKNVTK